MGFILLCRLAWNKIPHLLPCLGAAWVVGKGLDCSVSSRVWPSTAASGGMQLFGLDFLQLGTFCKPLKYVHQPGAPWAIPLAPYMHHSSSTQGWHKSFYFHLLSPCQTVRREAAPTQNRPRALWPQQRGRRWRR